MLTIHLPVLRTGLFVLSGFLLGGWSILIPNQPFPPNPNYQLEISQPDASTGKSTVALYEIPSSGGKQPISTDSMLFFIIMPDGNFLYVGAKDTIGNNKYQSEYTFQNPKSTPISYSISNTQVFVMKKNNPKPPKRMITTPVVTTGGPTIIQYRQIVTANDYLGTNEWIKVRYAWTPSFMGDASNTIDPDAYFYVIISYTNRNSFNINTSVSTKDLPGNLTGFYFADYIAYNLNGSDDTSTPWTTSPILTGSSGSFPQNLNVTILRPNEVRHLFLRFKRTGTAEPATVQIQGSMTLPPHGQASNDTLARTGTGPHDPNGKKVDQNTCRFDYFGTLTYRIKFQNEGNGVAKDVIIKDLLPEGIWANTIKITGYHPSKNVTVGCTMSKIRLGPSIRDQAMITLTGANLPGLAQKMPRRYTYNETEGWVEFSVYAKCPSMNKQMINSATIIFIDKGGNEMDAISTNPAITKAFDTNIGNKWTKNAIIKVDPTPTGGGGRNK